jgi:hypothetical protein
MGTKINFWLSIMNYAALENTHIQGRALVAQRIKVLPGQAFRLVIDDIAYVGQQHINGKAVKLLRQGGQLEVQLEDQTVAVVEDFYVTEGATLVPADGGTQGEQHTLASLQAGSAVQVATNFSADAMVLSDLPPWGTKLTQAGSAVLTDSTSNATNFVPEASAINVGAILFGAVSLAAMVVRDGGKDITAPSVTVTDNVTGITATGAVIYTIKFSEAVTGFDASKLDLSGGTLGGLVKVNDTQYTVLATPTANASGALLLRISTNGVTDAAGNVAVAPALAEQDYAQNVLQGTIVAGPVIGAHSLSVKVFNALGQAIAIATVDANGNYQVGVGSYTGAVSVLVIDSDNARPDYVDEVSKVPVDLSGNLLVAGSVGDGTSVQTLNINPITTVAAMKAGLQISTDGISLQTDTVLDTTKISAANAAVAKALLWHSATAADLLSAAIVLTVNADGSDNANANTYGKMLAVLAGMDALNNGNAQVTFNTLKEGITEEGVLNISAHNALAAGASEVGVAVRELPALTQQAATGSASLSGTAEEGGTLTANTSGITDPDGTVLTFSYQWQMADTANGNYANISGATASSYALASDQSQIGKYLRVVVTANNDGTANGTSFTSSPSAGVTNVNNAPVLTDTVLDFSTLGQNAVAPLGNVGDVIRLLVADNVSDADGSSALKGMAITGVDTSRGTLFYSINRGGNWATVAGVSDSSALLLADDGDTLLYFRPNAGFSGAVSQALTFRAWDQTSASAGTRVNVGTPGGSSAFSAATDTVALTVSAAPSLALQTPTVTVNSRQGAPAVWLDNDLTLTSAANIVKATVSIDTGRSDVTDNLDIRGLQDPMGVFSSVNFQNNTITLEGNATAAAYQAHLRQVFLSISDTTANRSITWTLTDANGGISTQTSSVQVRSAGRTLYVDNADQVILDDAKANALLDFCRVHGVTELVLYNSSTLVFDNGASNSNAARLAQFMNDARNTAGPGVNRIGFAVSNTAQIGEIEAFASSRMTRVDFLMSEYEYWVGNEHDTYNGYKALLASMNAASVTLGGSDTYTYLGWVAGDLPEAERAAAETTRSAEIAGLVDRVYLAAYNMFLDQFATNGQNLYDIAQGGTVRRLQDFGAAAVESNKTLTVVPIVSAEFVGPDTWGSGYWLSRHGLSAAEDEFAADQAGDPASGNWKSGLDLGAGYAYFSYSHLQTALAAPLNKVFFTSDNAVSLTDSGSGVDAGTVVLDAAMLSEGLGSEGSGVTYSIVGGADANKFTLDTATGELRFAHTTTYANPGDADQNNEYLLTLRVTSQADASQFATQAVSIQLLPPGIDLQGTLNGIDYSDWYLVKAAQADGSTWYALSTNGNLTHDSTDTLTHDVLDTMLSNGNGNGNGTDTDLANRSVTLSTAGGGTVTLALASVGMTNPAAGVQPGTALGSTLDRTIGTAASNLDYDGLLAIWDAYNGTNTAAETVGMPSGWQDGYYWAADLQSTGNHFKVGLGSGYVTYGTDTANHYVAFQLL